MMYKIKTATMMSTRSTVATSPPSNPALGPVVSACLSPEKMENSSKTQFIKKHFMKRKTINLNKKDVEYKV